VASCFPPEFSFRGQWRDYQARVLADLQGHLDDDRLHVVAAPGSGKTVLGLEVVRRLGKPTLVLAPTVTIREQWAERLQHQFLPEGGSTPDWVSFDLRQPRLFTVATYQLLHAIRWGEALESEEEEEKSGEGGGAGNTPMSARPADLVAVLREAGVRVVVVDEAHHLRSEWWRTLTEVIEGLDHPTVVALTATPPYDVAPFEWERYQSLCGPVDAEIPVPELVATGDLCPHQDCVHLTEPSPEDQRTLFEFWRGVQQFFHEIRSDPRLIAAVEQHPWLGVPQAHVQEILEDTPYFSSIVIFLHGAGRRIPEALLDLLGVRGEKIPLFDLRWAEILLAGCLYTDAQNYEAHADLLADLRQRLRRLGALERSRVTLRNPPRLGRLLATSPRKLDSIAEIVRWEAGHLGGALRSVILTDYIRGHELPRAPGEERPLLDIGVVPIFERLRREDRSDIRLGVLSGALVILPVTAQAAFHAEVKRMGLEGRARMTPLGHDARYGVAEIQAGERHAIVRLVTRLFAGGEITVLVGTKSLLGEGWDAPSINCLVLASFVGSFMLSNQMRGRAIRSDPAQPGKTANIWHLVCVAPGAEPGDDLATLSRRFRAFVGISADGDRIENGIQRTGIGGPPFASERIAALNRTMCERALDRAGLREAWRRGLALGVRLVEGVEMEPTALPRGWVLSNTVTALFFQGLLIGGHVLASLLQGIRGAKENFWLYLKIALAIAALAAAPLCLRALWLFLRHGRIESSLKQVGEALLATLVFMRAIRTKPSELRVVTERAAGGAVFCHLDGGTSYEKSLYLRALQELLDPIHDPRYLLIRGSGFAGIPFGRLLKRDYHAVPERIGRRKEFAEHLTRDWAHRVGPVELVYTRTAEGRRILLHARTHSLAGKLREPSERLTAWK
jgi:superfamily II DNA or RNA helicase